MMLVWLGWDGIGVGCVTMLGGIVISTTSIAPRTDRAPFRPALRISICMRIGAISSLVALAIDVIVTLTMHLVGSFGNMGWYYALTNKSPIIF